MESDSSPDGYSWKNGHLLLYLHLQPRSSKTGWRQIHDGKIKFSTTSPPVDNQANKQCIAFIAKSLRTAKSNISILRGETSRNKVIQIKNVTREQWQKIVEKKF